MRIQEVVCLRLYCYDCFGYESACNPHLPIASSSLPQHSDVDYFIEKLEDTIQFFTRLQQPSEDHQDSDDGFVPFI